MDSKRQKLHHTIDNNKIIILPIIIQKQIINDLINEIKGCFNYNYQYNNNNNNDNKIKLRFKNYALVNQFWFNYTQKLVTQVYIQKLDFKNSNEPSTPFTNNKFNFLNEKFIRKIKINFLDIKNESFIINQIKSNFISLEYIQVYVESKDYIGDSIFGLVNLNKLIENNAEQGKEVVEINGENKQNIIIDFKLENDKHVCNHYDENDYQINFNYQQDKNPFYFETNKIELIYDYCDYQYPYIYHLIRLLNPKNLYFNSECKNSGCEHHLQQFHSISKLNKNYESVIIKNDFIPLYSLYRFLQSPNLKTFHFNLQYHFISRLYSGPEEDTDTDDENESSYVSNDININMNFNFDEMDNFEFKQFNTADKYLGDVEIERKDEINGKYYGINEDDQKYCACNGYDFYNDTIQPYSRLLWNECMKLLTNNKTITNLSISCHDCHGCDWEKDSTIYD